LEIAGGWNEIQRKEAVKAMSAWIVTFTVVFIAWYVSLHPDYQPILLPLALIIIAIGAYACWQTVPSKE